MCMYLRMSLVDIYRYSMLDRVDGILVLIPIYWANDENCSVNQFKKDSTGAIKSA